MSAREGREGEGGKAMEEKETSGGGEMILKRDGEGQRNNKTSRAFFILHGFHSNLIVGRIMREKLFSFFLGLSAKVRGCHSRQPAQARQTSRRLEKKLGVLV